MSRISTTIALAAASTALTAGVGLATAAPATAAAPQVATVSVVHSAATLGAVSVPLRKCSFSEAFHKVQDLDDYYTGIWAPGIFYYWVGVYMSTSWSC